MFYNATRYQANEWGMGGTYKFAGFIYNPAVPDIYPEVTPDVPEDENKNQLTCAIPDLRVRTTPSLATDENILDLLPQGLYYNYSDIKVADNYEWYKIAEGQWCARVDEDAPMILPHDLMPPTYKVNLTAYKEGSLEADCAEAAAYSTVHVVAKPIPGYTCTKLMVNGKEIIDNAFKMPRIGNVTITAEFEKVTYKVTCHKTLHGKITPSKKEADVKDEITIDVIPNEGYRLVKLYSEQVLIKNNMFIMPAQNVEVFAEFEEIEKPAYEVGEKVVVEKHGNSCPDGSGSIVFHIGEEFVITNIVWTSNFTLSEYPYELSSYSGKIIGYFKGSDINYPPEPVDPTIDPEFKVGEKVKITGKGNSKPDGSGVTVYGVGWKKNVLDYIPYALYPYKIGTKMFTQGYYKEEDLKRV